MMSSHICRKLLFATTTMALALAGAQANAADAANWPDKPIRVIVGFPPGGGADMVARVMAEKMGQELGQPMVVENRSGATGQIATNAVIRSPADGYTLLVDTNSFSSNPALIPNMPYDTKEDFIPVSVFVKFPLLLIKKTTFEPKTVQELIERVKASPGQVTYGTSGIGSVQHLYTALFAQRFGLDMLHVPYKGGSQSVAALVGGQIDIIMANGGSSLSFVQSKQVDAIATTGAARSDSLPDVPTMAEMGVSDFEAYDWTALFAPKGTPPEIIEKLSVAAQNAVKDPAIRARLIKMGGEPVGDSPAEAKAYIHGLIDRWTKVVGDTNIKME